MTTLPPHPGLSGLAARDDAASAKPARSVPEERHPYWLDVLGPDVLLRTSATPAHITRTTTTPADVTRAANDDADHESLTHAEWAAVNARLRTRAALDRVAALNRAHALYDDPVPCGCCGPQLCCCKCHKEEA